MKTTFNKLAFAGIFLLAGMTGCQHDKVAKIHGEDFLPDPHPTDLGQINAAQVASGAAADAMLYDMHFHGNNLTSLGQVKLDLIRKGTPVGDPVVVYFSMPHDQIVLRETAVTAYLKTAGLADTQITMVEGENKNSTTPTAYNITGLYKLDGASFNGQAALSTDSAAAAPASK